MEYPKFKVCVRCSTFNQAKYIEDTMNGFVMQQTDFPFVCCIVDDASTDGEQEIIKKYMDMHFDYSPNSVSFEKETDYAYIHYAQHKENKNCYFAVLFLKENHYSKKMDKIQYLAEWRESCKYEALCEGDDYWINSSKLQKQADILNDFEDVILVHTGFITVDEYNNEFCWKKYNKFQKISRAEKGLVSLLDKNHMMTLTIMCRKELFDTDVYRNAPFNYDYTLFFAAAELGKIRFLPDKYGAYRKNPNGAMQSNGGKVNRELYCVYQYFVLDLLKKKFNFQNFESRIKAYFFIYTNVFFHNDLCLCKKVVNCNPTSVFLIPFSFLFAFAKRMKTFLKNN